MCCVVTCLVLIGPRAAALLWSLVEPQRWLVFDNLVVPILGVLFLPWTLLAYVLLAPDGVGGIEWVVLIIAFLIDIGSLSGGAYGNRKRIQQWR
jgi:hypothetical protein